MPVMLCYDSTGQCFFFLSNVHEADYAKSGVNEKENVNIKLLHWAHDL